MIFSVILIAQNIGHYRKTHELPDMICIRTRDHNAGRNTALPAAVSRESRTR